MRFSFICIAAAAVFGATAPASAQYFARYDLTPTAPATCDAIGIYGEFSGSFSANLVPIVNNTYTSYSTSGGPPVIELGTTPGPFPTTLPFASVQLLAQLPVPTTPPYTLVMIGYPLVDGQPAGLGFRANGVCNADGSATLTFINDIPVPSVTIPAMQTTMLWVMAALLALMAAVTLQRRRGTRRS